MNRSEISCVQKTNRYDPHEAIEAVGGVANGTRWKISQQDAVTHILQGSWSFYVRDARGKEVGVIVAKSRWGHNYIKTEADGDMPNNLLSLVSCPL